MPDYFTLDELRALPHVGDETQFPNERCEAAAAYIVGIIEREVGTSFVAREWTQTFDGGVRSLALTQSGGYVLSIEQVLAAGVDVTDQAVLRGSYAARRDASPWAPGVQTLTVKYKGGYSATPPPDVKEQALNGTRSHLLATADGSALNQRRTSLTTDQGVVAFVVAGENRPTGYPEVDAMILGWKRRIDAGGFA